MDTIVGNIIAISGSLRSGSLNTKLARAAIAFAPAQCPMELASIRDIPLYDGDVEAAGLPASVVALKDRISKAAGLLIVTPEYNNSMPGVLKNAIDWLTRPAKDIAHVFGGIPFGIVGATPGPGGTRLSQTAWLSVMRQLGVHPFFAKAVYLAHAGDAFDDDGALKDEKLRKVVGGYVEAFTAFVQANKRG
ncbi:MAG: NAD(P)H-dependent oxidoreductase [Deltaproteobacteria bacterium]|nr:NAD(P)H-dependent oxidoreductase [Nannocystaceae bacterium]